MAVELFMWQIQRHTEGALMKKEGSHFVIEITGPAQGGFLPVRVLPSTSATVRLVTTPSSIEVSLVAPGLRMPNSKMSVLLGDPWRFTEVLGPAQPDVRADGL